MLIAAEVIDIANKYLNRVKPSGPENVMALCPFHEKYDGTPERNPSFAMSTVTGLWFCHSCHARGTLRTFLRSIGLHPVIIDRVYKPLLETIDENHLSHKRPRCYVYNVDLTPLPESTLGLFDYCPESLMEEGFSEETLRFFDVGFDRQHNRVTYPLRDLIGRLVGVSGRGPDNVYPKYKVYDHEYETWGIPRRTTDKSGLLWNADRLYPKLHFSREPPAYVLVEGYKAVMWLHQHGYQDTMALMGSYMSDVQKMILERLGGRVYLFFDNDKAGHNAYKYVAKALSSSLDVRLVLYEGNQPTDLDQTELDRALDGAQEFFKWVVTGA